MTCPQCGADGLDYSKGHMVCTNPDCDYSEEIEMVTFNETEDYYEQEGKHEKDNRNNGCV